MKRYEIGWMAFAQAVHLLSLLTWLNMMDFIHQAIAGTGGAKLIWPTFVTAIALLYPILLISSSGAAWWNFAKRQTNLALVFISLPLFLSLPLLAYGFMVSMTLR